MPSACIAAGCKNRSNMKGIHFHRLPLRNPALLKLWLAKLKLKNPPVNAYAKICSAHFHPDCYLRDLRNELTYAKPKFWLKKDAIPTIFDFSHCSHSSGVTDVPSSTLNCSASKLEQERASRRRKRAEKKSRQELLVQISQPNFGCSSSVNENEDTSERSEIIGNIIETNAYVSSMASSYQIEENVVPSLDETSEAIDGQAYKNFVSVGTQTVWPINIEIIRSSSPMLDISSTSSQKIDSESLPKCPTASECNQRSLFGLDDSFYYCTSTSESESISSSEEDITNDNQRPAKNKFIVYESELDKLFESCHHTVSCGSAVVSLEKRVCGTVITYKTTCVSSHNFVWHSQPLINRMPEGNLLLAAATLYTGNTYTTLAEIFDCFGLQLFCAKTFYDIQNKWLFPAIKSMWRSHQMSVLSEFSTKSGIIVAGDGRCDSPGHSASYCTYTIMDTETNTVLSTEVVNVAEVKNSYNMEKEGLERCLKELKDYGVNVAVLATDRHPQIKSMMKNKYPTVDHQFDVWHMAKSITKQLNAASKRRECEDLRPWIKSITNHFWWASDTCGGSTVQLKERWISILRHIVDIHEWTGAMEYMKCAHAPLSDEEQRTKAWLTSGSASHKALQTIVLNKQLLNDMKQVTGFCHTGDLEVLHNVMLKYVPKRVCFSHKGMIARNMLAVLDNNFNAANPQKMTLLGAKRWNVQWSKRSKTYVAKKVKVKKTFSFREELMDATIFRLSNNVISEADNIEIPEAARMPRHEASKPSKSQAVEFHISRFMKNK